MKCLKTSLNLDPDAVAKCKKIAFRKDVSFTKFMNQLMKKAVKSEQKFKQRSKKATKQLATV